MAFNVLHVVYNGHMNNTETTATTNTTRFAAVAVADGTRIHRANCSDIKKNHSIVGYGATAFDAAIDSFSDFVPHEMSEDDAINECFFNACCSDGKA